MNDRRQGFVDFVYNVNKLNVIFALSSVALVIITIWMVWDDYDREWKDFQREGMRLEVYKTTKELETIKREVDQDALKEIEVEISKVKESIESQRTPYDEALRTLKKLSGKWYKADQDLRFEKAAYDVIKYQFEEAVHRGHENQAEEKKTKLMRMDQAIQDYRLVKESIEADQAEQQKLIDKVDGQKLDLEKQREGLGKEANILRKRISGLEVSFQNQFRNLPLVDFMQPSIKVRQIVLGDLRNDINFIQVPRVDRCTTCHLNIDRKGYEIDPKTGWFLDKNLREYVEQKPEEDRVGLTRVFATHPKLDLYLNSASKHPIDEIGCTTCHLGRDRGITFTNAAHTPSDEIEAERWSRQYGWHKMKYWDDPMLPTRYVEASCAQCHSAAVELPGANRLNRGKHLVKTLGCHGCHKISQPGFQERRKVGPDLRKIASKLDRDWVLKWVRDPKGFRPTTKMPKVFDLPNVSLPEDRAKNTAGIQAIVTYLFEKSERPDYTHLPEKGDKVRGRQLVSKVGCRACHIVGENDELGQKFGLRNYGPNLNHLGSKLSAGWLFSWLKDPRAYFPDTLMPNLRLTDQEAADITAYLLTLRNPDFENRRPADVDVRVRDQLVLSYLSARIPVVQANERLDGMSDLDRDLYLGEKLIARQGCFGCHLISGFEEVTPIGTELTEEGSKDVDKLDFALNPLEIPHTRYDWFYTKLKHPRVFDEGKVKSFDEKLRMPNYGLSNEDAHDITTALMSFNRNFVFPGAMKQLTSKEIEIEKGRTLVYEHNCRGCHIVEQQGAAILQPLVKAYIEEGLGESEAVGFTPPVLNGEGKKVKPHWLFSFLKTPIPIRPWLDVRMPTFELEDQEAIDITTYFSRLEEQVFPYRTFVERNIPSKEVQGGLALFSEEIYNCWTCHQKGNIPPKGDPASWAPDLTMARNRLKPEWIRNWLWDPQKIQPGTKMPTFFGDKTTYLPEDMAKYLPLTKGIKSEDGIIQIPSDVVINSLSDYIIYGLHQK